MSHRIRALLVAAATSLGVVPAAHAAAKPRKQFYLSLGDSGAVGQQGDVKKTTHDGFADQLVPLARKKGYAFTLVNQGCGGATTTSMLQQKGCAALALAPGAANYPNQTQVQAAVAFVKKHRARMGLVTISIGGNDVDTCIPQARVVLVHGSVLGASVTWRKQQPLAEHWTLCTPNRPGFGASPASERGDFEAEAPLIAELLGDGAHPVGH